MYENQSESKQENRAIIRKIGSTVYEVSLNFSKSSKENFDDKVIRLIKNDPQFKKYENIG